MRTEFALVNRYTSRDAHRVCGLAIRRECEYLYGFGTADQVFRF